MDDSVEWTRRIEEIEREHLSRTLARARDRSQPIERPTMHYTEIAEADPRSPLCREWNFYRREVGRLLAEGYEGKWVMIEREEIIGIWETSEHAEAYRRTRYPLRRVLLKRLLTREYVLEAKFRNLRWVYRPMAGGSHP